MKIYTKTITKTLTLSDHGSDWFTAMSDIPKKLLQPVHHFYLLKWRPIFWVYDRVKVFQRVDIRIRLLNAYLRKFVFLSDGDDCKWMWQQQNINILAARTLSWLYMKNFSFHSDCHLLTYLLTYLLVYLLAQLLVFLLTCLRFIQTRRSSICNGLN